MKNVSSKSNVYSRENSPTTYLERFSLTSKAKIILKIIQLCSLELFSFSLFVWHFPLGFFWHFWKWPQEVTMFYCRQENFGEKKQKNLLRRCHNLIWNYPSHYIPADLSSISSTLSVCAFFIQKSFLAAFSSDMHVDKAAKMTFIRKILRA